MIVSSRAHAAGSLSANVCADIGRPTQLTYQYVGGSFVWDICVDPSTGPMADTRSPTNGLGLNPGCITVSWSGPNGGAGPFNMNVGDSFTMTNLKPGNPNVTVTVTPCGGGATASMVVHTSCSQALCVGDKHGYFIVTGYA